MDVLAEEAAAVLGGAFTSGMFGRSGIGSRAGRALVRQQRFEQRRQAVQVRRINALSIVDQLRIEVESNRGQLDNRFLSGLNKALAGAGNAQRPDTILRKAAEVADRLLGYAPPIGPSEDYLLLKRLEETLRVQIMNGLSALTPDWWLERIPQDVRLRAQERKERRQSMWPWYADRDLSLVHYIDFADYSKIISRKDNWRDCFSRTFRDGELLRAKLRELEPIRNDVAHVRDLHPTAREKLRVHARDLLGLMGNWSEA